VPNTQTHPVRPLGDKVLVKPNRPPGTSPGGIALPDKTNDRPQRGVVVRVGPGKLLPDGVSRAAMAVKEGDEILFAKTAWYYDTADVPEMKGFVLVREEDVVAVVE
jgi:chaperonin GroES